jgi:hypothetical protein
MPTPAGILTIGRGLEAAAQMLGASHMVEEGPSAGWHEVEGELFYEDDLRCRADCPICAAQQQVQNALTVLKKEV